MTERLSPDEFGCAYCGGVDFGPKCMAADGSCADMPLNLPDPEQVKAMLAAEAEYETMPMTDAELVQAWARVWHDLWIDGDLEIAAAIPEALAKRGHELQSESDSRAD